MDAHEVGGLWLLREMWGFPAGVPEDERLDYLKAIMVCARAKGHLTDGEKNWVIGYGAACGAHQETVDALDAYDADEDIEDILKRNMPTAKTWGRLPSSTPFAPLLPITSTTTTSGRPSGTSARRSAYPTMWSPSWRTLFEPRLNRRREGSVSCSASRSRTKTETEGATGPRRPRLSRPNADERRTTPVVIRIDVPCCMLTATSTCWLDTLRCSSIDVDHGPVSVDRGPVFIRCRRRAIMA